MQENLINEIQEAGLVTMRKDRTYEIISKIAYLIGVPKEIFENERLSPKPEIYDRLEQDKNARIIRHLCVIRNHIERHYKQINDKIQYEYKSLFSIPEYVPQESIKQLSDDGINFYKPSNTRLFQHIIEINRIISDRINNCKALFPLWLDWAYIKELFIMPNGLTEEGVKLAATVYYANMSLYPYQVYINWKPEDKGNILNSDQKFVSLLYEWHGKEFTEYSRVSDAGSYIKGTIYDYIDDSQKVVVVVDCENSDPYKLCATLRNLDDTYTEKISSIILFDDVHTASAWRVLDQYTTVPVEHVMIERVKENKSLVDITLAARACQEHYQNNVDSFIIVSSDSDYWGLISSLQKARFLVMVEHGRCSPDLKNALVNAGIFYCYIDDFYSGNTEDVKRDVLFREMYKYIDNTVRLNVNDMFREALTATRIEMTQAEKNQFFAQYIKTMQMRIEPDGDVVIEFKTRKN